jgi:hypothetical protein
VTTKTPIIKTLAGLAEPFSKIIANLIENISTTD